MRIALITPGFSVSNDDWCIPVLRNLAEGLNTENDVEVFTAAYPARRDEYQVAGVPVRSFGTGTGGIVSRYREMRKLAAALRRSHAHTPFDLLHGFWANQGGLVSSTMGRQLGLPSLLTVMAGELAYVDSVKYGKRPGPGRLSSRYAALRATAVGTISRYQQQRLATDEPGLESSNLPFGVDTTIFRPEGRKESFPDAVNILMVGSLVPVKGHATALSALERVAAEYPRVHLHIVGDGESLPELRQAADSAALQSRVTFHGHVEHDSLAAYYRAADFCLLSSHFETSAMVIFEAAACGRLTVGSDVGSLAEVTPDAFRSPPGDAVALAAVLSSVLESPDRLRALGQGALQRVRAEFTVEHMIERYLGEYERLSSTTDRASSKT